MEIEQLAEWHRNEVQKAKGLLRRRDLKKDALLKHDFHLEAAKLIESFSELHQKRRLAEIEREVLTGAIESFDKLAKYLVADAKDLKRILSPEKFDED